LGVHSSTWGVNGVKVKGECHCLFSVQGPFLWGGDNVGGSIRENGFFICWLLSLEVAISSHVLWPTSSDARLKGGGWMLPLSRCILPFKKPFVEC